MAPDHARRAAGPHLPRVRPPRGRGAVGGRVRRARRTDDRGRGVGVHLRGALGPVATRVTPAHHGAARGSARLEALAERLRADEEEVHLPRTRRRRRRVRRGGVALGAAASAWRTSSNGPSSPRGTSCGTPSSSSTSCASCRRWRPTRPPPPVRAGRPRPSSAGWWPPRRGRSPPRGVPPDELGPGDGAPSRSDRGVTSTGTASAQAADGPPPPRAPGPNVAGAMFPYAEETFTDEEAERPAPLRHEPRRTGVRPGQPARSGEGRPVRPVLALGQEPAAALPRRVRRGARHHRRRRRRRHRRAASAPRSSTSGCSSSTATTRSPSSAACTWRASRRRTCSPRSSSGAGSWPTSSSRRATSPTTAACHRALPLLPRPRRARLAARRALRGRHGPHVRHLRRPRCPSCSRGWRVASPGSRATPTSCTGSRSGPRPSTRCAACCPPASLSNVGIYGTGQSYEQLLLRMRAHPLPEARAVRRADARRAAQGDPVVPPARRHRPSVAARGRTTCATAGADRGGDRRRLRPEPPAGAASGRGPSVRLMDFDPDGEDKVIAAMCYPRCRCPTTEVAAPGRRPRQRGPAGASSGPTSASGPTAGTGPGGRSSAPTTASRWCPTTGRSGTCNGTGCSPSSGRTSRRALGYDLPDVVVDAGLGDRFAGDDGALGGPLRRHGAASCPAQAAYAVALAYRIRYVDADERPRGDAPGRAALRTAGPSRVPRGRPGDAPADRRAGRAPLIAEAMTFVDHEAHDARAPRGRAPRRGAPRRVGALLTGTGTGRRRKLWRRDLGRCPLCLVGVGKSSLRSPGGRA